MLYATVQRSSPTVFVLWPMNAEDKYLKLTEFEAWLRSRCIVLYLFVFFLLCVFFVLSLKLALTYTIK